MNLSAAGPLRGAVRLRAARWLCVAGLLLLVVLTALPGASAHTQLTSSVPGNGQVLQELPPAVELTFSGAVATPAYVVVRDPAGDEVAEGDAQVRDAVVTQPMTGRDVAGDYTVDYRVVSADGHPVTGSLTFTVGDGRQPTTENAASAGETGGFWGRHWEQVALAGAGLLAGAALVGAGLRGRA